jgi:hypothetical protein
VPYIGICQQDVQKRVCNVQMNGQMRKGGNVTQYSNVSPEGSVKVVNTKRFKKEELNR